MSSIDTRSPFFPKSRSATQVNQGKTSGTGQLGGFPDPTSAGGAQGPGQAAGDARVSIPDGVRDFSRIKKAANAAPEVDNSEKIARLKAQIQAGAYEVDYDGLADKMLQSEY